MEQLFVVEEKGVVDSYWFCEHSIVIDYIDSKPCENNSRNSIERNSDWKCRQLWVFTTVIEKSAMEHADLVASALAKLTDEEIEALDIGITREQDIQVS